MRNFKLWMILVAMAFVVMGGCALREKDMEDGNEGEGEGEGSEGEGEGEGCDPNADYTCTCPDGREGFQVCQDDGTLGPCNCGNEGEGEGEGCEGEGEGGSECTNGQSQCVGNSWQTCGDNGFWGNLEPCDTGMICKDGVCVDNNPPDTDICEVWIDNGMLCGNIAGLTSWTYGCMPPGVEPVCELKTYEGTCTQIISGVDSAWPRNGEDWLTVVGCNVYDGLKIMSDPSGGHYLKLP